MAHVVNEIVNLYNNDKYYFSPKHRIDGNNEASMWTVTMDVELKLCENAIKLSYIEDKDDCKKFAFNLERESGQLIKIGNSSSKKGKYDLKIAKYNCDKSSRQWHGYPANHIANKQDKPNPDILDMMQNNKLITLQERRKIMRGQKI